MLSAVVTGASGALGRLVALDLARNGCNLAITSRNAVKLRQLGAEVRQIGGRALWVPVDVRSSVEVSRFICKVMRENRRIDAIVNCFGYVHNLHPVQQTSVSDLRACLEINVQGLFNILRKVIPIMISQDKGVVINVSSKAARMPVPKLAAYSASKAAVIALTQAVAKELSGTRVLCVTVSPSGMNTPMREAIYGKEDAAKQQNPETVAGVIMRVVKGRLKVPQGADILVVNGKTTVRKPEVIQ